MMLEERELTEEYFEKQIVGQLISLDEDPYTLNAAKKKKKKVKTKMILKTRKTIFMKKKKKKKIHSTLNPPRMILLKRISQLMMMIYLTMTRILLVRAKPPETVCPANNFLHSRPHHVLSLR